MTNETVWVVLSQLYEGLWEEKFWRTEEEAMEWIQKGPWQDKSHLFLMPLKSA